MSLHPASNSSTGSTVRTCVVCTRHAFNNVCFFLHRYITNSCTAQRLRTCAISIHCESTNNSSSSLTRHPINSLYDLCIRECIICLSTCVLHACMCITCVYMLNRVCVVCARDLCLPVIYVVVMPFDFEPMFCLACLLVLAFT